MKRTLVSILLLGCTLATTTLLAREPENLAIAKQAVIKYHDDGDYAKDINNVVEEATEYLKDRIANPTHDGKKPAIVLDIDETSLSNYPILVRLNFGGSKKEVLEAVNGGTNLAIAPVLQLYKLARTHHIAVFFITGRPLSMRTATKNNLKKMGYEDWAELIMRSETKKESVSAFKTAARKAITERGYNILLNVGDQESDLVGGYADKTFKLPNPYYFTP